MVFLFHTVVHTVWHQTATKYTRMSLNKYKNLDGNVLPHWIWRVPYSLIPWNHIQIISFCLDIKRGRARERASERPAKYYPVLIIIIINRPGATTTWLSSECLRGEDIIRMCGLLYVVGRRRLASCVVGGVRELGEVFVSVSPGKGATYLQPSSHFRNRHGTHWRSSPAFGPSVLPATLYIFYW